MHWQPIDELVGEHDRLLLWCADSRGANPVFGRAVRYTDGGLRIKGDGMAGDYTFTHFALIIEP